MGNTDYTVVLRGDSTLRGHFPEVRMLMIKEDITSDILIPNMLECFDFDITRKQMLLFL